MNELTVWCVCVGDKYNPAYVYALKESIEKYLTIPHEFKCITTHKLPGVFTVKPYVPYQGWWSKINLFTPRMATGPSIYFDLDTVITGSLDYLAEYTKYKFSAPANWAQSGWGGIQSSVMAWSGSWYEPFYKINKEWRDRKIKDGFTILGNKSYWGDQEYLWDLLGDDWIRIPNIYSYKYHCRDSNPPKDMAVCVFHGKPDPHEVSDKWILPFTATLHNHIKLSMDCGLKMASSVTA